MSSVGFIKYVLKEKFKDTKISIPLINPKTKTYRTQRNVVYLLKHFFDISDGYYEHYNPTEFKQGERLARCYQCGTAVKQNVMFEIETNGEPRLACPKCAFRFLEFYWEDELNIVRCRECHKAIQVVNHLEINQNTPEVGIGKIVFTKEYTVYRQSRHLCIACSVNCPKCGTYTSRKKLLLDEPGCTECVQIFKRQSYNYKPIINKFIHGKVKNAPNEVIGVELEVNYADKNDNNCIHPDILNHWIFKTIPNLKQYFYSAYDGSIEQGIEFCSMPFSFNAYSEQGSKIKDKFESVIAALSRVTDDTKLRQHPNCGMHIHVNRKALSTKKIFNILTFVYNNPLFMIEISERDFTNSNNPCSQYCKFDVRSRYTKAITKRTEDKYCVVNFRPQFTIEFRHFKASLNPHTIYKNIEFIFALIEWSDLVSHVQARHAELFKEFVAKNKFKYRYLFKFLFPNENLHKSTMKG